MFRSIFASILVAILLLGCVSASQNESLNSSVSIQPVWIANPEKNGYLSVVGSAPTQEWGGHQAQYRVALMKARQELAQMVRVQVESSAQFSVEENSGEVSRASDIETKLRSNTEINLDEARIVEEWTDPHTGELFLWLVVPK